LADVFPIHIDLEQGDALSPLCLKFAIEYAIKNQVGLKFNKKHQLLIYAHDINLLGEKINTVTRWSDDRLVLD
jgi:hypothetical protein